MDSLSDFEVTLTCSDDRKAAQLRVLRHFADTIDRPVVAGDANAVAAFLAARREAGMSANTLRKERTMIVSFFTWAWRRGIVGAETLLSIQAVPVPAGATAVAKPRPYRRREVRGLWTLLDARWPRLEGPDAERSLRRWHEGASPYARVRSHLIHLQLEAIVVLALSCGLRRAEIWACLVDDVHPDNAYITIRKGDAVVREAPHTRMAREAIAAWLDARRALDPPHDRVWLKLWAEPTATEPMSRHAFDKALRTYVGSGWTLRRLRDTCAVEWLRAGLEPWNLQSLLGHRSIKDTLPYIEAASRGNRFTEIADLQQTRRVGDGRDRHRG